MARGRGSGGSAGYTCVKFFFFAFNVLFWLLGCAILGVGIWLHISKGPYASMAPSFNFLSATVLCISAGIVVLVVGFFGCCGAIMENKCMLLTYFLLVVVIFVLEVMAGILAFVHRDELERLIKDELRRGIQENYKLDDPSQKGLIDAWNSVQKDLECCGVLNYTDWYGAPPWRKQRAVPGSCCKIQKNLALCVENENPGNWFSRGCLQELKYLAKHNMYIIGVVGVTIGVLQILGMAASMALFCCLREDK